MRNTTILIGASFCQISFALLDILFLALVGPLIISISTQKPGSENFFILGKFNISSHKILIFIVLIILVKNIAGLLVQRLVLSSFATREAEIGTALIQASLFSRIKNHQPEHSSSLLQTSTYTIRSLFESLFKPSITFIGEISTLFAVIVGLLIINTEVAIISICFFSTFGYLMIWQLGKKQQNIGKNSLKVDRELLRAFQEIKIMRRELSFAHKDIVALTELNQFRMKFTKLKSNSTFLNLIPRNLLEIAFLFGIGTVVLFLGYFQKSQEISPILALIVAAGYRILPSLNYVAINIGNFRSSVALLNQMNSLGVKLDIRLIDLEFKQIKSLQETKRFEGDLYLENVCYHYPISKKNIFTDFSLVVKSGQTLLIQGLSGTGKTTLVSLATGSLTPQQGRIYMLDGNKQFDMDHTVTGISYLSQDVPLLDESFAYNIAMEEPLKTNLKLLHNVASKSGILDRIVQSPMGFDTQIGENGSLLSAGERQRLGIARSLYFEPSLLILDEPTANLDPAAEVIVWETLAKIKGQCTAIIVSHRFVPEKVYDERIDLQVLSVEN